MEIRYTYWSQKPGFCRFESDLGDHFVNNESL